MKFFLTTLFIRQNKWHKYSVLGHTIAVTKECIKAKQYRFIIPALLHDVGKPVVAFQDPQDKIDGTFSFTDHEEKSYQMIKWIPIISERTKMLVRHHYLITGMATDQHKLVKAVDEIRIKNLTESFEKRKKIWDGYDEAFQRELMLFKIFDDDGKGYPETRKAVPVFLLELHMEIMELVRRPAKEKFDSMGGTKWGWFK